MDIKKFEIFVSPNGSDSNEGTFEKPLATLAAAKKKVRKYRNKYTQVSVIFRGGEYFIDENIAFGTDDGGYPGAPVIYKAYEGEKPTFVGGIKLDNSKMKPVTDEEFLSRLTDKSAAGKIYYIEIPEFADYLTVGDVDDGISSINIEAFENNKPMNSARFPKRDLSTPAFFGNYTKIIKYHKEGDELRAYFCDEALDRIKLWSDYAKKHALIDGFFAVRDWRQDYNRVLRFDLDDGYAVLDGKMAYKPKLDAEVSQRAYFYNISDELSQPGEYYIDKDKCIFYFVPSGAIEDEEIYLTTLSGTMITLAHRIHSLKFEGLSFKYCRGDFFEATDLNNVVFDGLEIANGSKKAINISVCRNVLVTGCHIYNMGSGGVFIQHYGERDTTVPRKRTVSVTVENCDIHDVARISRCYSATVGVDYDCSNVIIRNNKLHSSPHLLIYIRNSNDILIENNELYEAVRDSDDSGAVYWGRSSIHLGTVLRNNYFHDCGNNFATWGISCIYMDDGAVGADVYNNVFANVTGPVEYHGSVVLRMSPQSFSHVHNNVFVGGSLMHVFGGWHQNHTKGLCEFYPTALGALTVASYDSSNRYEELASWGFFGNYWKEHYKDTIWARMWETISFERITAVIQYKKELEAQGIAADIIQKRASLFVDNITWNHKLPDGSSYDGEYWDYVKTELKEHYDAAMAEVKGKSEAEILDRMILLTAENYWYNRVVPDTEVRVYDNVCFGLLPKYLDENGNMDMGIQRAESEYTVAADAYIPENVFENAQEGNYTFTDDLKKILAEKLPGFSPLDMSEIGVNNK